jgi:hypothetical protein
VRRCRPGSASTGGRARRGDVGRRLAVRRDLRLARVRDGEPGRKASLDGDGEQLRVPSRVDLAPRGEEHGLPVRREAEGHVAPGVVGEPPRHAARGGHHVDVRVALVAAGEGHERAVGREPGAGLDARVGGQAADAGAVRARHPQVVGVGERDERPAGGGLRHQPGVGEVDRPGPGGRGQEGGGENGESVAHGGETLPDRRAGQAAPRAALPAEEERRGRHHVGAGRRPVAGLVAGGELDVRDQVDVPVQGGVHRQVAEDRAAG